MKDDEVLEKVFMLKYRWLKESSDSNFYGWREYYKTSPLKIMKSCLKKGYYIEASSKDILEKLVVPELKIILKEKKLKVSGKKEDLIIRILEVLSEEEIKTKYYKEKFYVLSEEAKGVRERNEILKLYEEYFIDDYAEEITIFKFFNRVEKEGVEGVKALLIELEEENLKNKEYSDLSEIYKSISKLEKNNIEKLKNILKSLYIEFSCILNYGIPERPTVYSFSEEEMEKLIEKLEYNENELKKIYLESIKKIEIGKKLFTKEEVFEFIIKGLDTSFDEVEDYIDEKIDEIEETEEGRIEEEEHCSESTYEEENLKELEKDLSRDFKFLYRNIVHIMGKENDFQLYSFDETEIIESTEELKSEHDYDDEKLKEMYLKSIEKFDFLEKVFSKNEIFEKIILKILDDKLIGAVAYIENKVVQYKS